MRNTKANPTAEFTGCIESADALYMQRLEAELLPQRDADLAALPQLKVSTLGRMVHRLRIWEDFLTRAARERIAIYGRVANENDCLPMLATSALDALRDKIMDGVAQAIKRIQDDNRHDASNLGGVNPLALESANGRVERTLDARIRGAVNTGLRVLETGVTAARSKATISGASSPRRGRKARLNAGIEKVKQQVREMRAIPMTHQDICKRLGGSARPANAAWNRYEWPEAYLRHTKAVRRWLSSA